MPRVGSLLAELMRTITRIGLGIYARRSLLMERSDPRSLGPEWYHPMTFSRAVVSSGSWGATVDFLEHGIHVVDVRVI